VGSSPTSTIRPWISRFSGQIDPKKWGKSLIVLEPFMQKRL
jgi:hypothetical protein